MHHKYNNTSIPTSTDPVSIRVCPLPPTFGLHLRTHASIFFRQNVVRYLAVKPVAGTLFCRWRFFDFFFF